MRLIQLPALAGADGSGFEAAALGACGLAGALTAGFFAGALFTGAFAGVFAGARAAGLGVEVRLTGAGTGFFAPGALVGALAGMGFFAGALVDILAILSVCKRSLKVVCTVVERVEGRGDVSYEVGGRGFLILDKLWPTS